MSASDLLHTYADALPELVIDATAEEMPDPQLIVLNEPLAEDLGLDVSWLRSAEGTAFLTGQVGRTVAMGYAGHQFGQYSPRLGDGRAVLLGQLPTGQDLHVKGGGRTPFSRGGDGRGTLTSMLREFLYSESMHALGVDTTRTLAVITTGRTVVRENGVEPAALLVRVARGLTRVGTYQYARSGGPEITQRLADYDIARHYPSTSYAGFFEAVMERQMDTVAAWMRLGFIHGVMNTDNTSITGETIDYGPCAFTESRDPDAFYSSVDTQGRYRFGNQPLILRWNLTRLAETLLELAPQSELEALLGQFVERFETRDTEPVRPLHFPRNHLVADALKKARLGEFGAYEELLNAVTRPWDPAAGEPTEEPEDFGHFITYCGT
ncbi:protein adenylyltransferase SelO family protein [Corynebacterium doosanense]|uniref:Protein adenylyltransferase SelO n=1 Tax=Corynebacterium doosanense CAU 212 = DSM 45436 TaxID=558173 RepID=A0A097IGW7_9CORY|nr:protein adenylyltransferase SelO family protein [Corynebacterium doosanense]AIT61342.1 hypothetical protein CDOO_08770 [Corynebacterium doosanense CAU 212 = DSM 45436]